MLHASLVKRFGAFRIDVTLDVAPGRTLVLVGPSGSGKTTILRLLAGVVNPEHGRIELDGACYYDDMLSTVPAWERDVGYAPQDSSLFPHLSARDNIAFGLRAIGVARAERETRVGQAMEQWGVAAFADRRPHELSGGQQQRVALARALVLEPKLLLLDEPLSALDPMSRESLREELRRVLSAHAGATVFVTHNADEARAMADQVVTLDAGRASTAILRSAGST
jgi:ABC-type Fe3+/spermidine/putrescine transport system ATPase subunit